MKEKSKRNPQISGTGRFQTNRGSPRNQYIQIIAIQRALKRRFQEDEIHGVHNVNTAKGN
jgi:hypothetical protein